MPTNPQLTSARPHQQHPPQPPPAAIQNYPRDTPPRVKKSTQKNQTITSEYTPTNQESLFTQPEAMNKPEIRSHSNSRKRFSKDLDTHLDPISYIFEEHNQTSLNFT